MVNYILAIHAGHNASALIGTPNEVLYAVQEERLTGEKNFWGFPEESIKECLKKFQLSPDKIEQIVVGRNQIIARYHSREDVLKSYERQNSLMGKFRQRFIMPAVLGLFKKYGQKEMLAKI